ncbi:MAG: cytidylate kinase [Flavobacteriales bacterium]|nr:MAG: cytidylate kinase [Flavobacteriales bacterium]
MSLPFNIAIDGYSSSGKSTLAKKIASKYTMEYIDTGAMYRAVTYYFIKNDMIRENSLHINKLDHHLNQIDIDFSYDVNTKKSTTILNNENVEDIIRSPLVSKNVSVVSKILAVRNKLIHVQQKKGEFGNIVMDGRDIGSIVFPDAGLKLFITADIEKRAERRFKEFSQKGYKVNLNDILMNIKKRDNDDTKRELNPLIITEDAFLINNSDKSINDQLKLIDALVQKKLKNYENNN